MNNHMISVPKAILVILSILVSQNVQAMDGYLSSPRVSPVTHETEFYKGSWSHFPHELENNWHLRAGLYTAVTAISLDTVALCAFTFGLYSKRPTLAKVAFGLMALVFHPAMFAGLVAAEGEEKSSSLPVVSWEEAQELGWTAKMYVAYQTHWDSINSARMELIRDLKDVPNSGLKSYSEHYWNHFTESLGYVDDYSSDEEMESRDIVYNAMKAFESISRRVISIVECSK